MLVTGLGDAFHPLAAQACLKIPQSTQRNSKPEQQASKARRPTAGGRKNGRILQVSLSSVKKS